MMLRVLIVGWLIAVCGCGCTSTATVAAAAEPPSTVASVSEGTFAVEDNMLDRSLVEVQPVRIFKSGEKVPAYPSDAVALVVEPLQEAVLPFQAVVLRISLVNRTNEVVGPFADIWSVGISDGKREIGRPWKLAVLGGANAPGNAGAHAIMLGPRQRLSVDIAIGETVEFRHMVLEGNREVSETVHEPIFFAVRNPVLEAEYQGVWMRNDDNLSAKFSMRLADPTGDERACFERLKADPGLARCLYNLDMIPEPTHIPLLEEIVRTWPTSSYADYVRLALARARVGAAGERLPRMTRPWAIPAAGQPDRRWDGSRWKMLPRQVSPLLPQANGEQVLEALSTPNSQSFRERFVAGIRTQSYLIAGFEERRQAVALLGDIRSSTFPFAAHALLWRHRIAEIDEPERLAALTVAFDRDLPLSDPWLRLLAESYYQNGPQQAAQAWVDYRIRTSNSP